MQRCNGLRTTELLRVPLIRTLTVGSGISPNPPVTGCERVADFNCRFGITPTPEQRGVILAFGLGTSKLGASYGVGSIVKSKKRADTPPGV